MGWYRTTSKYIRLKLSLYPGTHLPKNAVSYIHVTKWGSLFLPNEWNSETVEITLNEPDLDDEANLISEEILIEETRAAMLSETFNGFVMDYIEEGIRGRKF